MAKTRAQLPQLQAAALVLEERGQNSLLYNARVIDYLTNSTQAGNTELAWYYYSRIPELRYTCRYVASSLSVATLYVGETDTTGGPPKRLPKGHPAIDLLEEFAGGYDGQSELLDRLGLHLTVTGDSILIGPKTGTGGAEPPFDQWRVYSVDEVYARSGNIFIKLPGNALEKQIPDSTMAFRIWRPHPRRFYDSDSPVKGSFSVLRELDLLDQHVAASAISRLAGAGIMVIPDEIDLPNADMETEGTEIDRFVALLTEVMGLAIKNRESASALIPIMLRGPAEYIDKIQHFDFHTAFSDQVPTLRDGAIRRLALGMDVPPDILLGSSQSNSWSAWETDASTLRVHLIPMLQLISSSLTVGWLRPMLESLPLTDKQKEQIPNLVVHFDVSNLKIQQDVSGDSQALYDRMEIGADALRMATGYGVDDAPTDAELAKQILLSMVRGGNPQMVPYALTALRDNFGLKLLPYVKDTADEVLPRVSAKYGPEGIEDPNAPRVKATAPIDPNAAGPGRPPNATPPVETPIPTGPVPGQRSQDKQMSPPSIPKGPDPNNNKH